MAWNLQGGVDCATSGVLALTALLFKMEEANLASRAKAQELLHATNQILSQAKPLPPLAPPQGSGPTAHPPAPHLPPPFLLHGALPLGGGGGAAPTPLNPAGLSGPGGGPGGGLYGATSALGGGGEGGKRDGSGACEGRGDTDKYLKKLHTQERAVEEVKLAIKPYYQRKDISKDEYKDILRKAVHKICHSRSGEINPVKVSNLVRAYVQRYKYFRRRRRAAAAAAAPPPTPPPPQPGGGPDAADAAPPLPMPPL